MWGKTSLPYDPYSDKIRAYLMWPGDKMLPANKASLTMAPTVGAGRGPPGPGRSSLRRTAVPLGVPYVTGVVRR